MIRLICLMLILAGGMSTPADAQTRPDNREIGRIVLEEVLGRGRIADFEHLYAPDFVAHGAGGRTATRAEDRAATIGWRQAFPDMEVRAERIVADGELVAVHFRARGTNSGSGGGMPATGVRVEAGGITIFRITDGRIREEWTYTNFNDVYRAALAAQAGVAGR